ncbi:MAG: hypothetical protein Q8P67_20305, partial [archaeon]|nr:hypothetical protein [archaeon]
KKIKIMGNTPISREREPSSSSSVSFSFPQSESNASSSTPSTSSSSSSSFSSSSALPPSSPLAPLSNSPSRSSKAGRKGSFMSLIRRPKKKGILHPSPAPTQPDWAFFEQLASKKAAVQAAIEAGSVTVAEILEENLELVLRALEAADDCSRSDDGHSIFTLRYAPAQRVQANQSYVEWMELLNSGIRTAVIEFNALASRLPGESPANVILQVKDCLSAVEPRGGAEKLRLDFLKDLVDEIKRNDILPVASFVPAALSKAITAFLSNQVLPLIRGSKSLEDVNSALFDHLDEITRHLSAVKPVSLGARSISASEIKDIVEQILLSQVAMFNYHGLNPNSEIRQARSELGLIRSRLDAIKASQAELMEIVSDFFVGVYSSLLHKLVASSAEGATTKPDILQFSPKNVFFVLMSELIHHLLLSLPPKIANAVLQQHRGVLFSSESMLESATKLLEAEDYYGCGKLRSDFERFMLPKTVEDSRMDLLFSISAAQFWRVLKNDQKEASFAIISGLVPTAVDPQHEPTPRRMQFLLAAHRIIQSLGRNQAANVVDSPNPSKGNDGTTPSAVSSSSSSSSAAANDSSTVVQAFTMLPNIEAAIFQHVAALHPDSFDTVNVPNLRVLFRTFFRYLKFARSLSADVWPPAWHPFIESLGEALRPGLEVASSSGPAPVAPPLPSAIESQDLMAISTLLRSSKLEEGSPAAQFSDALHRWFQDFLDLYRARFDFVCPFGMGIESFQCDADNSTKLPNEGVRAYTLSTGTVISEFGRRGMGLERLEEYDRKPVGKYTPRDPTSRREVEFYFRDGKAEQAIGSIFASLRRLTGVIHDLEQLKLDGDPPTILQIMRRYIEQFDSTFLEKRIHLQI